MDVEAQLIEAFAAEPAVVTAWLFGSVVRGTDHARSDIDIAIVANPPSDDRHGWEWELAARLTERSKRPVQVIAFDRAPADLARRVLRDGKLLVDRDRSRRIALEVKKRNEYFDMTPVWRRIRRLAPGVMP